VRLSHRILVAVGALGILGSVGAASAFAAPAPSSPAQSSGTFTIPSTSTGGTFVAHSGGATITVTIGAAAPLAMGPTTAGVGAATSEAVAASNGYVVQYVNVGFQTVGYTMDMSGDWQYNGSWAYVWGAYPTCSQQPGLEDFVCGVSGNGSKLPNYMVWNDDGAFTENSPPNGVVIPYFLNINLFGNGTHQVFWSA
jgi:hypothetical protein